MVIELLLFIISNLLIFYWIFLTFKFDEKTIFLNLKWKHIMYLLLIEFILITLLYFNYHLSVSSDIANSFIWHNMFIYPRGTFSLVGFDILCDGQIPKIARIPLAIFGALLFDYLMLLISSFIADFSRSKSQ